MERSAETISHRKFQCLPVRRQHALLSELAVRACCKGDYEAFLARYEELQDWAALDRYLPPAWLLPREALEEFYHFHAGLGGLSPAWPDDGPGPVSWQPRVPFEIIVDQVRNPYNIGSLLRLIDNCGFARLVHATDWLRLDHPQLRKAARGCEGWVPVCHVPDMVTYLRDSAVPIIGIEQAPGATAIDDWTPPKTGALLLGNESYGIAHHLRQLCRELVCVPVYGYKHSMNVTVACTAVARAVLSVSV